MSVAKYRSWKDIPEGTWRWKSFKPTEIACRGTECGCGGAIIVDTTALDCLQRLRDTLGKPLIINSAYRCPKHNKSVSTAKDSHHTKGDAFDVSMKNHNPAIFIASAKLSGFRGIGTYPPGMGNFVHVDLGPSRTWGKPFRSQEPEFTEERKPKPLVKSRIAKGGAAVATVGGGIAADGIGKALEAATPAIPLANTLAESAPYVLAGLLLVGIAAWIIWARRDMDRGEDA